MNTFGRCFRVTTFGESHGGGVGCVIDGCPPRISIDLSLVQKFLDRRRPGQSPLTSPRAEKDQVECLSGLNSQGLTLGTPITLFVRNEDKNPGHYESLQGVYRPSHADYTTQLKYGISPDSGGGRASARETIGRVAAASIGGQVLASLVPQLQVRAWVESVRGVCVVGEGGEHKMSQIIAEARDAGDSVGGVICCEVLNPPSGLGVPVFDKLEADLAKAMLSLPATKGFEVGSGFQGTHLLGSEHNDEFYMDKERVRTRTNHSGGIQGGISNGESIFFRVAFKPVSTIFRPQRTVTRDGADTILDLTAGRHDPCVLPRALPMVEAMTLLVLVDHFLRK